MIKEAMQYIESLAAPTIQEIHNRVYTNKSVNLVRMPTLECLTVRTLSAITNYVNSSPDTYHVADSLLVHIEDHNSVYLYNSVNDDEARVPILHAALNDVSPKFGTWYDTEMFNIVMQSRFAENEHSRLILCLIGNIVNDNSVGTTDDGVTQKVTVRTGISLVGKEKVPNPVSLIPYRTFMDASQPESKFVLRVRDSANSVEAALFEADGGAWKNEAIQNIRAYLHTAIDPDKLKNITILA